MFNRTQNKPDRNAPRCAFLCCLLTACFAGCRHSAQTPVSIFPFGPSTTAGDPAVAKRFAGSSPQGPSAVESAIELSQKYAAVSEQATQLKQQVERFETENQRLKSELSASRGQLQQAQKELNDANALLLDMRVELNNWKNNVLGFRDEMRTADRAQIEALLKILTLLGGESRTETTQLENPGAETGASTGSTASEIRTSG